ncbi:conserved hypothetical protein [Mesorhizobium plurifarium]|uniref:ABM domain-containing protein n=1 Tax=Mesorhizobium plurifarium TaxID=69974 RepID=A0A090F1J8_MESPL|nr:conserved hypothetical protein [Mesorhizobium sp. SOD10]CDX35538.1 conserved hypothetical protein [Mesorhizobium plurifarium]
MAYLEITLQIAPENRGAAADVYQKYKQPFLAQIAGTTSKELLIGDDDVQLLHGFKSIEGAKAYADSAMFNDDAVTGLMPLLSARPEFRIYATA